jgi:drug/metabolite transporter (DMT)-like permease
MALMLALGAAVCYAAGFVLQFHEAHEAPDELFLSPRLLASLVRHPLWICGLLAVFAGQALQGAALDAGSLAVVEPVLTLSLLFALPLSAAWRRERLTRHEWLGAIFVSAGLGVLLGVGAPTAGRDTMPGKLWLLVMLAGWGAALAFVAAARRSPWPAPRAALLSAGCGVLFGLEDALTPYCLHLISHDPLRLLVSWQPIMFLATGLYGMVILQSAYKAGPLTAALPPATIGEPVVGMLVGIFALGERLSTSTTALGLEAAAAAVMISGTWMLGRSPLVCGRYHPAQAARRQLRELEARLLSANPDAAPIG